MAFQSILENAVEKFNKRVKDRPEFQKVLEKYKGRLVTINIQNDATYIFHLNPDNVTLTVSSENNQEDMYIEISKEVFQKIIENRRINLQDLLHGRIKWKNISLKEVKQIKKILGIKSLNLRSEKF